MFIVIEGSDGAGKATQAALLKKRLEQEGKSTFSLSFPMYDEPSSALVRHYLNGDFGSDPMKINPHTAALFYAADRAASVEKWRPTVLNPNVYSIADRYVGSNAVHQGAKMETYCDKIDFFRFVSDLEFNKLELPKPDITIYLNTSVGNTIARMRERKALKNGEEHDIHESNLPIQKLFHNTGLMAAKFYGWTIIECGDRSKEDIAEEIYQLVANVASKI